MSGGQDPNQWNDWMQKEQENHSPYAGPEDDDLGTIDDYPPGSFAIKPDWLRCKGTNSPQLWPEGDRFIVNLDFQTTEALSSRNVIELARGFLRYEALRKLNPRQFMDLKLRNINGEIFDRMVDELVAKGVNQ